MASVLRDLGIELQTFNGKGHPELPVPATFIVAPDHTVAYAYVEADFRQRLEPAHLLEKLAQLARASS
jgi:peroxiredoxin